MMASIYAALKNDGSLLFAENLKATAMHQTLRKWFAYKAWRYISIPEALALTSMFSQTSYKTFGYLGVLGRTKWLSGALSTIDSLLDEHLKDEDKYIISCVCRK